MEPSSRAKRFSTISGSGSPYFSFARAHVIELSCSSAPSMNGGKTPSGIGRISSIISAILFGFVTTTSYAFSLPR